jgi:hypothetical protein
MNCMTHLYLPEKTQINLLIRITSLYPKSEIRSESSFLPTILYWYWLSFMGNWMSGYLHTCLVIPLLKQIFRTYFPFSPYSVMRPGCANNKHTHGDQNFLSALQSRKTQTLTRKVLSCSREEPEDR